MEKNPGKAESDAATDETPTCVVRLTPPGRGALATVRVEGPAALLLVERHFRPVGGKRLRDCPPGRPLFGHFGPEPAEEVVVCRHDDGRIELHGHGGLAAPQRIETLLVAAGARPLDWRAWLVQREPDPIAAAARQALAAAPSARTAGILLDQLAGALRRDLETIVAALGRQDLRAAAAALDALLSRAALGEHLTQPWHVVLGGLPNAGKSSLINALLGYQRAIVHGEPGTTRDVLTAVTLFEGWPIELRDTAGIRQTEGTVERAGVELARRAWAEADLGVLVSDASRRWSPLEDEMLALRADSLVVHNKSDLPLHQDDRLRPAGLLLSAATGAGLDRLTAAIAARLVPHPPPPGAAVPFTRAQTEALRAALQAVRKGDAAAAIAGLAPWHE